MDPMLSSGIPGHQTWCLEHVVHTHVNKTFTHIFLNLKKGRISDDNNRLEYKNVLIAMKYIFPSYCYERDQELGLGSSIFRQIGS